MAVLTKLKRLRPLAPLGATGSVPVSERFNQDLLSQWKPLIKSLAFGYSIPGKLPPQDIEQELSVVLWKLTKRVDPTTEGEDFRRLVKTEMRNRCVDLNRFHRAQKRMSIMNKLVECKRCGRSDTIGGKSKVVCQGCGASGSDVEVSVSRIGDVSLEELIPEPDFHPNGSHVSSPDQIISERELYDKIIGVLREFPDRRLFILYVDPPLDFVHMMIEYGYDANPRKAPYWLLSKYMGGVSEKSLRMAYTRICLVVAQILERGDKIHQISSYNLERIGFSLPK